MYQPQLPIAEQVGKYTRAGAHVISVLTEPDFFKGSLDDLRAVRTEAAHGISAPWLAFCNHPAPLTG